MSFVQDLLVRIRGDKTQLDNTLKGAEGSVKSFGSTIMKLGGIIGAAFSVGAIVAFSKESMKLAAEAEGVKNAWAKIGNEGLLSGLMAATRRQMDDSDLMALAIKAKNFKIPLQDLNKYLEFSTNRAITMGKSVSEFAEIMVAALGKGAAGSRALLQLGLKADDVKKSYSDFGSILSLIASESEKMGVVADTAAIRMGAYRTSVISLKEAWGDWLNNSKLVAGSIESITYLLDKAAEKIPWYTKLLNGLRAAMMGPTGMAQLEIEKLQKENAPKNNTDIASFNRAMMGGGKVTPEPISEKAIQTYSEKLTELNEALKENKLLLDSVAASDYAGQQAILAKNAAIQKEIDKLTTLQEKLIRVSAPGKVSTGNLSVPTLGEITPLPLAGEPKTSGVIDPLKDYKENLAASFKELKYMTIDFGAKFAESLGEAMTGGNMQDLGKGLLLSLADFMGQFGKSLIVTGLGIEAFQDSLKSMNPAVAIAAGLALMVAAGAVRGLMAKGVSGSSGGGGGGSQASFSPQTINVVGVIKGKDIYISQRRYVEDNG